MRHRDSTVPCPRCKYPVSVRQALAWPEAVRINWFLTGYCLVCALAT